MAKKYKVFFGCSPVHPASTSKTFDTEDAAKEHMHKEARELASNMGVDVKSRYFILTPTSYNIITGEGANYSGCLITVEED
jgi:hypothetical protein